MAHMAFESLKKDSPSVEKMLDRYEDRVRRGIVEKAEMDRSFAIVESALKSSKALLKNPTFFASMDENDFFELSNAWRAWGNPKFFPDPVQRQELATVLIQDKANKGKNRALVYARQIWRTEMTATIIQLLGADTTKADPKKSRIVERVMASQVVSTGESTAIEALTVSMHLDPAIKSRATRQRIAAAMNASPYKLSTRGDYSKCLNASGGLDQVLRTRQSMLQVTRFRVTVGGDIVDIPKPMRESLVLKNLAFIGDRIYAQMGNGCEGNLVIIDIADRE